MSNYYSSGFPYSAELYHHGIKGQKWGVRRFQNSDGSLTPLGRLHYYGINPVRKMVSKTASGIGVGLRKTGEILKNAKEARRKRQITKNPKKYMNKMTSEEIIDAIERINLEKKYADIARTVEPYKESRAKKFVKDFIEKSAGKIGDAIVQKAVNKITEKHENREIEILKNAETIARLRKNIKDLSETDTGSINLMELKKNPDKFSMEDYADAKVKLEVLGKVGSKAITDIYNPVSDTEITPDGTSGSTHLSDSGLRSIVKKILK